MQNTLIIGGSRFVGPLLVEKLLGSGHRVTVFNRGRIQSHYPEDVRFIKGDRNEGFAVKERFDTVVDMCAYNGIHTERALRDLKFDFFVHFGTAAAYAKTQIFPLSEDSPLGEWPVWGDYNKGKVECERTLERSGVPYAVIRPVYILGPNNYVEREKFIYSRIKNSIPLVLPGNGQALIQFVAAADVAGALLLIAEKRAEGAFNCASDETITLKGLALEMAKIVGNEVSLRYNPYTDGEKFSEQEFPFANENFVASNKKLGTLGIHFIPLVDMLKKDYESYYKKIV